MINLVADDAGIVIDPKIPHKQVSLNSINKKCGFSIFFSKLPQILENLTSKFQMFNFRFYHNYSF